MLSLCPQPGCGRDAASTGSGSRSSTPVIYTTFYPTTYMTSRLIGPGATVVCPVPSDADPALWRPGRDSIAAYQNADVIIINGAAFEKWVAMASLPDAKILDSSAPLRGSFIRYQTVTHSHGPGGAHTHSGLDGHTWLDPINAIAQADEIARGLTSRWPARADDIQRNLEALHRDLKDLDRRLQLLAPQLSRAVIFASHPAYNYIDRRYAWNVHNITVDTEAPPDDKTLASIRHAVSTRGADTTRVMLWEEEPAAAVATLLREHFGIRSVVFSPCEMLPESPTRATDDFLSVMTANIDRLGRAIDPAAGSP